VVMHSHPNGNWMVPHPAGRINYYNGWDHRHFSVYVCLYHASDNSFCKEARAMHRCLPLSTAKAHFWQVGCDFYTRSRILVIPHMQVLFV
jgi:hypothetical protein